MSSQWDAKAKVRVLGWITVTEAEFHCSHDIFEGNLSLSLNGLSCTLVVICTPSVWKYKMF
jgi:hypothetical protein